MNILQNQFLLFTVAALIIVITTTYTIISFKTIKREGNQYFNAINSQISKEKKLRKQCNKDAIRIDFLEQKTQLQLNSLKVKAININFTLHEIFKSI